MILLPPGQRLPVPADGQKPLHVITDQEGVTNYPPIWTVISGASEVS
jgi:hypothetical protein